MLKIAGVKSEKEFYKKFPDEASFMAKHGKEFKKAMRGSKVEKAQIGTTTGPQLGGENFQPTLMYDPSQFGYNPYATPRPTVQSAPIPRTQLGDVRAGASPAQSMTPSAKPSAMKGGFNAMPYLQSAADVIEGAKMLREERDALREARQMDELMDVQELAVMSRPKDILKRQYVRPEDVIVQPEQLSRSFGVGTNPLAQDGAVIGGNPTEIMNIYNPGTIYTDLGYEPLNDSAKVKQFLVGGKLTKAEFGNQSWMKGSSFDKFMGEQGGAQVAGGIATSITGNDGGSKLGGGLGRAAGTALGGPVGGMVGEIAGKFIGGALDQKQEKIEAAQERTNRSKGNIIGQTAGINIQHRLNRFMQDGGETSPYKWVSHTWQPQVIATFGEHKLKDLLTPPNDADMLRAGGHLKEYTPPSAAAMSTERPNMQLGGELQTHWGGYAEPISYNPYLPDGGETVMFRGQSHDESDGQGNTGIGITYGNNPVEVERGEPAVKLQDGGTGEENLTVFGNIKITNAFADMLADPKAKGKKFKTYVADLSKQENKQNKLMEKSIDQLDDLNVQSSFDKLALGTLQANIEGANAKLKDLADRKVNAASLQNAINDSKDEKLLEVTDSGDVLARKGATIPTAPDGITTRGRSRAELANVNPAIKGLFELLGKKNYDVFATSGYRDSTTKSGKPSRHSKGEAMDITFPTLGADAYNAILNDPDVAQYMLQNNITAINEYDPETQKLTGATGPHIHFGFDKGTTLADKFRKEAAAKYPDALTPVSQEGLPKVSPEDFKYLRDLYDAAQKEGRGPAVLKFQQEFHRLAPEYAKSVLGKYPVTAYGKKKGFEVSDLSQNLDSIFGKRTQQYMAALNSGMGDTPVGEMSKLKDLQEVILPSGKKTEKKTATQIANVPYKRNMLIDAFNTILPYLRPSDIEELNPNQLIGEMYALSQNQVEPVWAQKFIPELGTPVDISLQDVLNANQADYNATQRQVGYNPAALASLNAQKYAANQKVLGEQFRLNQAEKQRVYGENRNLLNQAKLQNLQTLERQADKQAQALSKTKATTQAALNSIASKYAQNKLENRTLAVMENMYNYRYSPNFRAVNMNPLWQPNIPEAGSTLPIYGKNNQIVGYREVDQTTTPEKPSTATPGITAKRGKALKKNSLNSSVVKALKNI